jgi:restriction endonuclease Mrr
MLARSQILKILRSVNAGKSALHDLTDQDFEAIVALLLESRQCPVKTWVRTGEQHVDILATTHIHVGTVDAVIQCKRYSPDHPVDVDAASALLRSLGNHGADIGVLVTTSYFTDRTLEFCEKAGPSIDLIDGEDLLAWLRETLKAEETRAAELAFRIDKLLLTQLQCIQGRDLPLIITPEYLRKLALPADYERRIVLVENAPFRLVRQIARDPRHMRGLTPRQFEEFVSELLDALGFKDIILTPEKRDGGKDIIATRIFNQIPVTCYFECKKYAKGNKVQLDTLRALLGTIAHNATQANIGVLVTTSTFTKGCWDLIMSEARLDGKDYDGILRWLDEYKKLYPSPG